VLIPLETFSAVKKEAPDLPLFNGVLQNHVYSTGGVEDRRSKQEQSRAQRSVADNPVSHSMGAISRATPNVVENGIVLSKLKRSRHIPRVEEVGAPRTTSTTHRETDKSLGASELSCQVKIPDKVFPFPLFQRSVGGLCPRQPV